MRLFRDVLHSVKPRNFSKYTIFPLMTKCLYVRIKWFGGFLTSTILVCSQTSSSNWAVVIFRQRVKFFFIRISRVTCYRAKRITMAAKNVGIEGKLTTLRHCCLWHLAEWPTKVNVMRSWWARYFVVCWTLKAWTFPCSVPFFARPNQKTEAGFSVKSCFGLESNFRRDGEKLRNALCSRP